MLNLEDKETTAKFLNIARRMNHVNRCAGTPMNSAYSVTEHCAQAALLYVAYCAEEGYEVYGELLAHILGHDILEVFTGDMLYPAKHLNKKAWDACEEAVVEDVRINKGVDLSFFDDEAFADNRDRDIWVCCDALELYMKCVDEWNSGNRRTELRQILQVSYDILENRNVPFFIAQRDAVTSWSDGIPSWHM